MPTVKTKKSVTFVDEATAMSDASSSSICEYKLDIATPKTCGIKSS